MVYKDAFLKHVFHTPGLLILFLRCVMDFKISVSAGARASDEIQFICDCKHNMRNRENACAFVFYSFKVYKSKLDFNKCSSVLCLHPYVDSTELSAKAFLLLHLYCGRDFFREPHASGE